MDKLFDITTKNRKILYHFISNLSENELHTIPKGFNNTIWWNIAHVVVTQQKLVYGLSDLPLNISQYLVSKYQKGTVPDGIPEQAEVEEIKSLLFDLPEQTIKDFQNGRFINFNSYMTTPKVELNSVEDAITFNVFHEGLHVGSIMALIRALKV